MKPEEKKIKTGERKGIWWTRKEEENVKETGNTCRRGRWMGVEEWKRGRSEKQLGEGRGGGSN